MSNKVAIIGIGCTKEPGKSHINKSFKELLVEACYKAIKDAGIKPEDIEGASFSYSGEGEVGHGGITPTLVDALGLAPIPAFINCANCASAHTAFLQGCDMVKSGKYKTVIVAGFDKCTDVIPFTDYMLWSSDTMYDCNLGFSHIHSFMLGTEYIEENKIPKDVMIKSMIKYAKLARENAYSNPIATMYKKNVPSNDEIMKMLFFGNVMVAGEGASAIILTSEENSLKISEKPILVEGTGFVSTSHYVGHRYEPSLIKGINENIKGSMGNAIPLELACKKAYDEAGITPNDINILQVYDQLINHFISLEATGICEKGKAPEYILSGKADVNGECPINTDGGNIGRGHPGGAASIYQIIEITKQLQGRGEGKQIRKSSTYGLSTAVGGYYATAIAVILSNKLFK
ncbi:thiolase family protein [Clostridium butyricum]